MESEYIIPGKSTADTCIARSNTVKQLEKALDAAGVTYYVRHVMFSPPMPRAITIASTKRIDASDLNGIEFCIMLSIACEEVADGESVGAFVKRRLADYGYNHVAVCSRDDVFDQTRGETIALGRLLKAQCKIVNEAKPKRRDTIVSYISSKSLLSCTMRPGVTRIERDLKRDFYVLGVKPHVATFLMSPPLRIAVTIASAHSIDCENVHAMLWDIVHALPLPNEHAEACVKRNLARHGFTAVAICSRQDVFDQARGEVIALGRLRKELLFKGRDGTNCVYGTSIRWVMK